MRAFRCTNCKSPIYFENFVCGNCGVAIGFDPDFLAMRTLLPNESGLLTTGKASQPEMTYCRNYNENICNWLAPADGAGSLCKSCSLNRTIPDLSVPGNYEAWFEVEKAKRRLIYTLLKLGLPVVPPPGSNVPPLVFDIVSGMRMGHENGLITINLDEADPAKRELTRVQFNEPYRTLLGHFRHESGHYYWLLLVNNARWIDEYRAIFGDERPSYADALAAYHQNGPAAGWEGNYISAYATAHSWEDWAESWAHYLHMADVLETAEAFQVKPKFEGQGRFGFRVQPFDPYRENNAVRLIERWIPLAITLNNLNRSMGLSDFYPFIVSASAAKKLEFVRQVIRKGAR